MTTDDNTHASLHFRFFSVGVFRIKTVTCFRRPHIDGDGDGNGNDNVVDVDEVKRDADLVTWPAAAAYKSVKLSEVGLTVRSDP